MKKLFAASAVLSGMLLIAAPLFAGDCCGGDMSKCPTPKASTSAKSVKAAYSCPMHPEVTSDKPGKCPKCGMNLVKKQNASVKKKAEPVIK